MSVVLRTIQAFPYGRTTCELFALLDSEFDRHKRRQILSELDDLQEKRMIRQDRKGRWHLTRHRSSPLTSGERSTNLPADGESHEVLTAVPARFEQRDAPQEWEDKPTVSASPSNPQTFLQYYRAALRADPRGAIVEYEERHEVSWQLVTGAGALAPERGTSVVLTIELENLPSTFREALFRREANENLLAVGWPIEVIRPSGMPEFLPVGLLSAHWSRKESRLEIEIESDDILANPKWLQATARLTAWSAIDLGDHFVRFEGTGLKVDDFVSRLSEAVASRIRSPLMDIGRPRKLNRNNDGIHNIFGLFLPTDNSFTAGASKDLDSLAKWETDILRQTALADVLGLNVEPIEPEIPVINVGPLNAEQIQSVEFALTKSLTVVTGPPGTGKSQSIVAMVTSVLAAGKCVLVASRNHQALDAVQGRLSRIAPTIDFLVRTLDPASTIDRGFNDAVKQIAMQPNQSLLFFDPAAQVELTQLARQRTATMKSLSRIEQIRLEMADLADRIESRKSSTRFPGIVQPSEDATKNRRSLWQSIVSFFLLRSQRVPDRSEEEVEALPEGTPTSKLIRRLRKLRSELAEIEEPGDPIEMTETIGQLAGKIVPAILSERTKLSGEQRQEFRERWANLELLGSGKFPDTEMSHMVVKHRPLWLVSTLGTPKRVPLEPGLFDLVIFDEASQCDIASALPLLARAKRAVVVGDNNQLSFIPQLGIDQDRNLMRAQGLEPTTMGRFAQSRRSLFDMASLIPGAECIMLKQQYRSAAAIVDYISQEYYGGGLRVAGNQQELKCPPGKTPGMFWTHVPAPRTEQRGNVNPAETTAIVSHLSDLLEREDYVGTVGVVTPFRPQAFAIWEAISNRLPHTLVERAELRAGTVDSFQGDERDLILFSPCLGPSSTASALTFVTRDWRRLNVAISRARAVVHVFGDLDFARTGRVRSLKTLAEWATRSRHKNSEFLFDSIWEMRVHEALKRRNLEPVPQYEVAGRRLDFALFGHGGIKLDLEVDGRHWHADIDGNRKTSDLWRDRTLRSLGWRVRRFWVDELAEDMEKCIDLVELDLK